MSIATFIRELIRKFPSLLGGTVLLLLLESLLGAASVLTIAPIVDSFITPDLAQAGPVTQGAARVLSWLGWPVSLGGFLALFVGANLLKNGAAIASKHFLVRTKLAVLRDLTLGTFEDFFQARWQFFSAQRQGTLVNTFLHEMTIVGDAFGQLALFCASAIQVAFYVVVALALSWSVTLISLSVALALAWPLLLLGRIAYQLGKRSTAAANDMGAVIQESHALAKLIVGFGNQGKHLARLAAAFDAHCRPVLKARTLAFATPLLYEPFGMLVLMVTLLAAQRFAIPLSETAVLLWTLRSAIPLLGGLAAQKNSLLNFLPSYEQIQLLRRQARDMQQRSGARPFTGFTREILVERATFAYPGHEPVLWDVSLRIPAGRMVALVGESGSGKSTLIDLIMGFHQPSQGLVTFDDIPLEEFDVRTFRQRIGYVPQDSVLFNMSIRENLRWANEAATDAELKGACRQANAAEFIERLPAGYDTVVGDRGVRLSGGQCQRLALARALLRKPDLLILDEATSALDTQSERLIQEAIEAVAKETTVVVIAHRLSTIVHADYVYVLHQGRIIEEGTYQALVGRPGPFSRMTQMQLLESAP